ncbi:MAG: hypothetical protein ACPGJV_13545 [Bacteriovoracaceae bacterium]
MKVLTLILGLFLSLNTQAQNDLAFNSDPAQVHVGNNCPECLRKRQENQTPGQGNQLGSLLAAVSDIGDNAGVTPERDPAQVDGAANASICMQFSTDDPEKFLEEVKATGLTVEEAYFEVGCQYSNYALNYELIRLAIMEINHMFDSLVALLKEFRRELNNDRSVDTPKEKEIRTILSCALTQVMRANGNIMQELDDSIRIQKKILSDPDYYDEYGAGAKALDRMEKLKRIFQKHTSTYPVTEPASCPKHFAGAN